MIPKEYTKILSLVEIILGKGSTTNFEIEDLCKQVIGSRFKGCYSSDEIPKLKNNESCIVNLDDSSKRGSHWVAVYKNDKDNIVYDSFGRKSIKILPSIFKMGKVKDTEYDAEQNMFESNCGQRCISALVYCYEFGVDKLLKL